MNPANPNKGQVLQNNLLRFVTKRYKKKTRKIKYVNKKKSEYGI